MKRNKIFTAEFEEHIDGEYTMYVNITTRTKSKINLVGYLEETHMRCFEDEISKDKQLILEGIDCIVVQEQYGFNVFIPLDLIKLKGNK